MIQTTTIKIKGMDCTGCEASVKILLETVDGVKQARVSFKKEKAEIEYDDEKVNIPKDIEEVLKPTQYKIQ